MNASKCESCGYIQYHNNSCRDRCCPMCQALSNEIWIDAQNEFVLDVDYFHLVFTCPEELNPLTGKHLVKLFKKRYTRDVSFYHFEQLSHMELLY